MGEGAVFSGEGRWVGMRGFGGAVVFDVMCATSAGGDFEGGHDGCESSSWLERCGDVIYGGG